jgi:hypothetical protein
MKDATHRDRVSYQPGERGLEVYPRRLLRAGAYDSLKACSVFAGQGNGSNRVNVRNNTEAIKTNAPLKDVARRLLHPLEGAINMLGESVDLLNEGLERVCKVELVRDANIEASCVDSDSI